MQQLPRLYQGCFMGILILFGGMLPYWQMGIRVPDVVYSALWPTIGFMALSILVFLLIGDRTRAFLEDHFEWMVFGHAFLAVVLLTFLVCFTGGLAGSMYSPLFLAVPLAVLALTQRGVVVALVAISSLVGATISHYWWISVARCCMAESFVAATKGTAFSDAHYFVTMLCFAVPMVEFRSLIGRK